MSPPTSEEAFPPRASPPVKEMSPPMPPPYILPSLPKPPTSSMLPPEAAESVVSPAVIRTSPPLPMFPLPTVKLRSPPEPPTPSPVISSILPDSPAVVLPVAKDILPLTPEEPEFTVSSFIAPLFVDSLYPVLNSTSPPRALAARPPVK